MDNPPSFDRGMWIPIGVGVFSLIGICVILVAGRITALRGNVQEVPTATAFKYAFVGTEPVITTITPEPTEFATPAPTEPPIDFFTSVPPPFSTPVLLTPNGTAKTPTSIVLRTNTPILTANIPARTPTSASTAPFGAGTFDDPDYRMMYSGDWTMQSGVSGALNNTLHVSGTLGNTVSFRFIGQELRVFFEAGPSLGVMRLNLDGTNYDMNESNSTTQIYEWVLPSVTNGTHVVTITHLSGGSINLDYIIIPEVPTTPTKTATTNP